MDPTLNEAEGQDGTPQSFPGAEEALVVRSNNATTAPNSCGDLRAQSMPGLFDLYGPHLLLEIARLADQAMQGLNISPPPVPAGAEDTSIGKDTAIVLTLSASTGSRGSDDGQHGSSKRASQRCA